MSDIVERLRDSVRACRAIDRSALLEEAAAEIERLRGSAALTDAEREALRFAATAGLPETEKLGGVAGELCRMHAARLQGLLERLK
jgi:hypothetical protein